MNFFLNKQKKLNLSEVFRSLGFLSRPKRGELFLMRVFMLEGLVPKVKTYYCFCSSIKKTHGFWSLFLRAFSLRTLFSINVVLQSNSLINFQKIDMSFFFPFFFKKNLDFIKPSLFSIFF
jgi:hypothetical protein